MISNSFILDPTYDLLPAYRISPFQTKDVSFNHLLPFADTVLDYFEAKFKNSRFELTVNGREAICLALKTYNLAKDDVVTILTTSQNYYISSCVTREIEKFCRWNREITPETKVIFVNHEFGYIYPGMEYLVSLGLPIIEDCCTTFFSQDKQGKVGKYGDFAVYSFPKFFPIQIGGLLVCNHKNHCLPDSALRPDASQYILKVLSFHLQHEDIILKKRKAIFDYGAEQFIKLGFTERFERDELTVPSAMMLNNHGIIKDLPALKTHLWNHGIQSSVFYGEDAFFIPSHQRLSYEDIQYFLTVISNFKNKQR